MRLIVEGMQQVHLIVNSSIKNTNYFTTQLNSNLSTENLQLALSLVATHLLFGASEDGAAWTKMVS